MHTIAQTPMASDFNAYTTSMDIIEGMNLRGKVAIVTGGYSGLGLEVVKSLAKIGAHVIVPTRDLLRAQEALTPIEGSIEIEMMDLLDPDSIDAFCQKFLDTHRPLNLLIHCAGIMACPQTYDARGYEIQFATNHLGHFQLAYRLWSALQDAKGARVVSVSSWGHHFSPVVFEDIHFKNRPYDRWLAYGQSKTANILFAVALDEKGKDDNIRAFSVHPGGILATNLGKYIDIEELRRAGGILDENDQPIHDPSQDLKNIEEGAATILWSALSPELKDKGGVYCVNCNIASVERESDDFHLVQRKERQNGVCPYAIDKESAHKLWDISLVYLGIESNKVCENC